LQKQACLRAWLIAFSFCRCEHAQPGKLLEALAANITSARSSYMKAQTLVRTLCVLTAGCVASSAAAVPGAGFDQSHALFDGALKQFVHDARVDYAELKAHPQDLNRYLDQVAAVAKADFRQWDERQQMAFLINVYNAYTLRLILNHYPVKSIKDIGSAFSGPWNQPVVRLFGETLTLDTVEHKILRKDYHDPRIHFTLVCAAKGCPPLRNEVYVAPRLDEQLDDQARKFLANPQKNRVETGERVVYLSPIFKWYAPDFEKQSGSVLAALKPYWPGKPPADLASGAFRIRYTDYNWSLNDVDKK
jgi:hypothetical protein